MRSLYAISTAVSDKHLFWERTIVDAFGAVDIKISNEDSFFGEMRSNPFGDLQITEVVCDYEISARTRRHIARDKAEAYVFVLLKSGRLRISQLDRECELTPGTFALFDLNTPYSFRHVERTDVLDLTIPSKILRARIRDPHELVARTYPATSGVGRITADLMVSLAREVKSVPDVDAHSYCGRIIDMLGVMFESSCEDLPIANSAVRSALYRRCKAVIETNIGDPMLNPAKIAATAGISSRYLHKIFQDAGGSVGDYVRERRFVRAHIDLSDPAKQRLTIGEIAFRAGFQSQSHFSNSFKRRYGRSPSDIRSVAESNQPMLIHKVLSR